MPVAVVLNEKGLQAFLNGDSFMDIVELSGEVIFYSEQIENTKVQYGEFEEMSDRNFFSWLECTPEILKTKINNGIVEYWTEDGHFVAYHDESLHTIKVRDIIEEPAH